MKLLFKILNPILFFLVIILSVLLFSTKEYSSDFLNRLNDLLTSYLYIPHSKDLPVAGEIKFNSVDLYRYENGSNTVYSPFSATVLQRNDEQLLMKCQNGYYCVIDECISIHVKRYDVVHENDILGYFNGSFVMYFFLNDQIYSYEEII